jgi:RNA polymerase sigma factor (sigma-70 family)
MPFIGKNTETFKKWWLDVEKDVITIGRSFLGSLDAAYDIAQEVAIAAYRDFDCFNNFKVFHKWVKVRTRWLALDELRYRKHEVLFSEFKHIENVEQADAEPSNFPEDNHRRALIEAIKKLPNRQKQVVIKKLNGSTNTEIAEELGIEPSTVRSLFRHAQVHLSQENE